VGQRNCNFYVIKSGEVEIIDESAKNPKTIATLGPGEFTGEVSQLTGGPSPVSGVARADCNAFEVSHAALRELLNHHPEVGDVILRAFIARRHFLHNPENFAGLLVIGSRYSKETFRVREFLGKNGIPYRWVDLDADPQVDELLTQFQVSKADMPVVSWGRKLLLRNPSNRELAEQLGLRQPLELSAYDLVISSVAGQQGWQPRFMERRKGSGRSCWNAPRREARPDAACGSKTILVFPPASPAPNWQNAQWCKPASSVRGCRSPRRSPV
jgi:thioredoxin reductase (NADPH)